MKILFILIFLSIFLYALIRPFENILAKSYLLFGSICGTLSIVFNSSLNNLAYSLGFENGSPTFFLYISLVILFLLIFYSSNEFSKLNRRNEKLAKEIALINRKLDDHISG